jgi:hypothetical protein
MQNSVAALWAACQITQHGCICPKLGANHGGMQTDEEGTKCKKKPGGDLARPTSVCLWGLQLGDAEKGPQHARPPPRRRARGGDLLLLHSGHSQALGGYSGSYVFIEALGLS